jgi:hypothetical protein
MKLPLEFYSKIFGTIVIISAVLFLVWACVPKPVVAPVHEAADLEEEIFLRAENFFKAESYNKALKIYRSYLADYRRKIIRLHWIRISVFWQSIPTAHWSVKQKLKFWPRYSIRVDMR